MITGAAGFLGQALVAQASALNWNVRATSRQRGALPPGIDFRPADVGDPAACLLALRQMPESPSVYNVSSAPATMQRIVETPGRRLGPGCSSLVSAIVAGDGPRRAGRSHHGGRWSVRSLPRIMEKWLSDEVYCTAKIQRELGFTPAISLEEGLLRQVQAYRRSEEHELPAREPAARAAAPHAPTRFPCKTS